MVVAGRVTPHDEWGGAPVHRAGVFGLHGVLAMPAGDVRAIATERLGRLRRWYAPVMDVPLSSIVCDAAGPGLGWAGPPAPAPVGSLHCGAFGAGGGGAVAGGRGAPADPTRPPQAGGLFIIWL